MKWWNMKGKMSEMIFRGFKKLSLADYPGKVCAIAFTGGCNFRCPWCYVKDLVVNWDRLPKTNGRNILKYLISRKEWIDALVISGGEPSIHSELIDFMKKVKEGGFLVGLETNGSNPIMLKKLINEKVVDYIEMDIKAPLSDSKLYNKVAGANVNIDNIKKSISIIRKTKNYAFRTTVVPTLLKERDIVQIAKEIKGVKRYYIQQFRPMESVINEKFARVKPYGLDFLSKIREGCSKYVKNVNIRH